MTPTNLTAIRPLPDQRDKRGASVHFIFIQYAIRVGPEQPIQRLLVGRVERVSWR